MKLSNISDEYQDVTINGKPYRLALFFESKYDVTKRVGIVWKNVLDLTYIDELSAVGLYGELHLVDFQGLYTPFLDSPECFYIGFYICDPESRAEDNIYFSILSCETISGASTTSSTYKLKITEAFMGEAEQRNLKAFAADITSIAPIATGTDTSTNNNALFDNVASSFRQADTVTADTITRNLYHVLEYGLAILRTDLAVNASSTATLSSASSPEYSASAVTKQSSTSTNRLLDLDEEAIANFKTNYPTDVIGEAVFNSFDDTSSVLDLFDKVNKNMFWQKGIAKDSANRTATVSGVVGEAGSCRCENISRMKYLLPTLYQKDIKEYWGARYLTMRSFKDTFLAAFSSKKVYEGYFTKESTPPSGLNCGYISFLNSFDIKAFPTKYKFISKIWADYIISPINCADSFSSTLYRLSDMLTLFKTDYLSNKFNPNIEIKDKISRGVTIKRPPFDDNTLNFVTVAETIKSFFTLNSSVSIVLPGAVQRKANEIVYVDSKLLALSSSNSSFSTVFANSIVYNYYFVTKVRHSFQQGKYINEVFMTSFCSN
jgi:hypothetical protein